MLVINRVRNAPKWKVVMPGSQPAAPTDACRTPS